MNILPQDQISRYLALGELGLDGQITAVTGALPAAMAANARDKGLICPKTCGAEAAWASDNIDIIAPESLIALINHINGSQLLAPPEPGTLLDQAILPDMKDIKGQESARRALEIAAAGGHNLLMIGPPGAGKSMLASRLPGILPPLSPVEMLEASMIASIAGNLPGGQLSAARPFRDPHHSASMAAMIGGGLKVRPGEVSLAHNGVLFLDELPEFSRAVLDSLRQPMETGTAVIARANSHVTYPARFQLIAAMNPCRCGGGAEAGVTCRRGPRCAADYQARISGPFFDRIDLRIEVPALSAIDLAQPGRGEPSARALHRVTAAREIQRARFQALDMASLTTNAQANGELLEMIATPDQPGLELIRRAARQIGLSARGYTRVLKTARTIADLEGVDEIKHPHIAEALSYRQLPVLNTQAA